MKKNVLYIKANVEKPWPDYPEGYDWDRLKKGGEPIGYFDFKILDHLKNAKKGDIVVLHSTKQKKGKSCIQNPRIVGFGAISEERKYSKEDDKFVTRIEKVKDLELPFPIKDLKHDKILMNSEPFRKGSCRCAVTKLLDNEYQRLKEVLINLNIIEKKDFDELES